MRSVVSNDAARAVAIGIQLQQTIHNHTVQQQSRLKETLRHAAKRPYVLLRTVCVHDAPATIIALTIHSSAVVALARCVSEAVAVGVSPTALPAVQATPASAMIASTSDNVRVCNTLDDIALIDSNRVASTLC
jgi:C4-dicarboxylate transporter